MANSNRNGMAGGNLKGHLALLAAYTIFGVNIVPYRIVHAESHRSVSFFLADLIVHA